jgi:hypothetical protein
LRIKEQATRLTPLYEHDDDDDDDDRMTFPHGSKIFHKGAKKIRMFQNQFAIVIDQVPVQIKMGTNKVQKN